MFAIHTDPDGLIRLEGRLDAASVATARDRLDQLENSARLDFTRLDYIASAGLGLLVAVQIRLRERDQGLVLTGLNPHLREVVALAGFEGVFAIE